MPELPEVESYRAYLEAHGMGRRILRVDVRRPGALRTTSVAALARSLAGRALISTRRHGKYLFGRVRGAGWIVMHFGMNGYLASADDLTADAVGRAHAAVTLRFARDGALSFVDPRTFGRFDLVDSPDGFVRRQGLGVDALEASAADFTRLFDVRRGGLKALLMDQRAIAGIGNLYADEVLFHAGLHPWTGVPSLSAAERARLYRATGKVLREAIARRAGPEPDRLPRTHLTPHREAGTRCPSCGGRIATLQAAGRTTYYCRRHQRPVV